MNLKEVPVLKTDKVIDVVIPNEYYKNTDIVDIPKFSMHLVIEKINEEDVLELNGEVNLVLKDAITLDLVSYPVKLIIKEKIAEDNENIVNFLSKFKNTLDIIGILWENIVLEIPISYTTHELKEEIHDNWQVVGKKKKDQIDPRLAPLLELFDKEKE